MDRTQIALFGNSLMRCMAAPEFIADFYDRFVAASPEVAEKFRETDFERQHWAMTSSLYVLVLALEKGEAAIAYLEHIAWQHGRHELDIPPEMYDLWSDCLIRSVKECDPQFSEATEHAWRDAMAFAVDFMKKGY